jgi:hypothetical protein
MVLEMVDTPSCTFMVLVTIFKICRFYRKQQAVKVEKRLQKNMKNIG